MYAWLINKLLYLPNFIVPNAKYAESFLRCVMFLTSLLDMMAKNCKQTSSKPNFNYTIHASYALRLTFASFETSSFFWLSWV